MRYFSLFLFVVLFLTLSAGVFFIWQGIYFSKDFQKKETSLFKIEKGQDFMEISANLEKEGLIKNRIFFQIYVLAKQKHNNLQAGSYLLAPAMSVPEMAEKIFKGQTLKIKVTIPEGFTIEQIEQELKSKIKTQNLKFSLKSQNLQSFKNEFNFLQDIPDDASLEGFLFPDTYFFEPEMSEKEVVKVFLANLNGKLNPRLREEIKKQEKTIFDVVKMASLLEKEVKTLEDKKLVSGILWKRLEHDMPLQVDATISFITGKKTAKVSFEEIQIDSPYNTYKYQGLPIGPICSPGLDSILAAIYPQESEFWYYLSTPEGKTIFSKALKEHILAKEKYLK